METTFQMDHHNQPISVIVDFLIIGGGVAGLSAANRLVDLGENPVLIEAFDYPSHKICGEFISPEALPYLQDWDIVSEIYINKLKAFSGISSFNYTFPTAAASMSRYELDKKLSDRAQKNGAIIHLNTRVTELIANDSNNSYIATLSNGKTIEAHNVLVGGGRFFNTNQNQQKPKMPYVGFKAHFSGIDLSDTLEMHLHSGTYLGISPVKDNVVNVACLKAVDKEISNPKEYIENLFQSPEFKRVKEKLDKGKLIFDEWLFTAAPSFEVKTNPILKNVYFIGDAAGTIPPATGNGLGMAITSGYMAADYAVNQDYMGFLKAWKRRYASRVRKGQMLHNIMMKPNLTKISFFICKKAPFIPNIIFSSTREK